MIFDVVLETIQEVQSLSGKNFLSKLYAKRIKKKLIKTLDQLKTVPISSEFLFELINFSNITHIFPNCKDNGQYGTIDINDNLNIIINRNRNIIKVIYYDKPNSNARIRRVNKEYKNGVISKYSANFPNDKYTELIVNNFQNTLLEKLEEYILRS